MNLHDAADRHRANLDKTQHSKILGTENADVAFVDEKNVVLILQSFPMHGPQTPADVFIAQRSSVVEVVNVVVVDRRQPCDENRAAGKRACTLFVAQDELWA